VSPVPNPGLGGPPTIPPEPADMRADDGAFDRADRNSYSAIRAPSLVLDVPARSLAVAMADQEEARLAPSRTLAMLSLPSTARAPAKHAVLVIIFAV